MEEGQELKLPISGPSEKTSGKAITWEQYKLKNEGC